MRIVVDTSIAVAALLKPTGMTATALHRREIECWAPRALFAEVDEHRVTDLASRGLSAEDWIERLEALQEVILPVPETLLEAATDTELLGQLRGIDPDDAPFIAALVAMDAECLWTRDRALLRAFPSTAVRTLSLPQLP